MYVKPLQRSTGGKDPLSQPPLVAETPDRRNIGRVRGIVLDLQPQAPDIHVYDLELTEIVVTPDQVQDLLAGERLAGASVPPLGGQAMEPYC